MWRSSIAQRGKADRTVALEAALTRTRQRFGEQWGVESTTAVHVMSSTPQTRMGLQIVDYFLWAPQRFYERGDFRATDRRIDRLAYELYDLTEEEIAIVEETQR